ncbi:MAG: FKBP-type peptidyl-prolyl cis-trans isomerase [Crocinitomicaceae bacterium]|nr:FKBP-type peptidyl-prolyl cis-trans isomerase [Crocinitomicaceae bacterium]
MKFGFLILFVALIATSCQKYSEQELNAFDEKISTYVKKNKLEMTKSDSGLYYQIHEKGTGDSIKAGALISVIYTGKLLNGRVFDQAKEPIELELSKLILGWREVVYYMRVGGKASIIVPPQLGYAGRTMPEIPKNSILQFDIEVVDAY